ncbi:ADP-ribose pyrophosphatase YjhB, NUDIX family [Lentimicrobium saccharophilum]|uniref:ADP-ribose pyrophosphatase YjhB, NUDIX family n=1 Tax=Lentimicrobium saccharophilum TaxID=1678841 RepID=A0A0S7BZR2_9BACT|nr:NUDIX hydrolase [Lentimicrobium saccharophilum]GAP41955.1 ADP-ribose pyrophosphatase YjhB, NUDIX family [Lentimicrobium saccharophilum]
MFTYPYPRPAVTVDAIVFRMGKTAPEVLLIRRGHPPFEGMWAAPGGFLDMEETPEKAVVRELEEETGINGVALFQVHTYGAVNRDPRHRTISIAYAGMLSDTGAQAKAGDDAAAAEWHPVGQLPPLAFDHDKIVEDAIAFARERGWF